MNADRESIARAIREEAAVCDRNGRPDAAWGLREALNLMNVVFASPPAGDGGELRYATDLAKSIAARCYPDVPQWEPLPDLMGVLTQIDNMSTGMERKP